MKKTIAKSGKAKDLTVKKSKKVVSADPSTFKIVSKFPMASSTTDDVGLSDFTRGALRTYGSYVVEHRAVPDFRDGLKPSHRAVLWSLVGLSLRPNSAYKKSARTVGDAIGKYHPHGDMGTYDAMVTIANTVPPMVDGQGGWGSPNTRASAMRYTEGRMSKFAHSFLLDPEYLKVVPYVPNFSNDDTLPLYLPALLPALMFITNIPAPAYGVKAGNTAFSMASVSKLVVAMLRGKNYTAKQLTDLLEIRHPYGCIDVSKDTDIESMLETGKGAVTYAPITEYKEKEREIHMRSFVPSTLASLESIDRTLSKITMIDGVRAAFSRQGKKVKNSGPYGALFVVECQKNISDDRFDEICHSVDKIVQSSISYRLGVTVRKAEDPNDFKYLSFMQYFSAWIKYRLKLELRLIESKLVQAAEQLHVNEVYLFAIDNMDKLLKALPKVLVAKDPDEALAKVMKMPVEDARIILDRKIRQLAKMEAGALRDKIKALKAEIKQLNTEKKNPGERAALDTERRVKAYLKNPDKPQSGIAI